MDRFNSAAIRRDELIFALRNASKVLTARRIDTCLLCRNEKVNDAGLCELCYSTLEGDELNLAVRWTSGVGP